MRQERTWYRCWCSAAISSALLLVAALLVNVPIRGSEPPEPAAPAAEASAEGRFQLQTIRGRIVWMAEAMRRLHGVSSVDEAADRVIALETAEGQLYPLVDDIRGRAFRRDERLRNLRDCELLVRQYPGSPMVQVIRLYSHENGQKLELDYFCEICAIVMFELKPCDCCQGDIELRKCKVETR